LSENKPCYSEITKVSIVMTKKSLLCQGNTIIYPLPSDIQVFNRADNRPDVLFPLWSEWCSIHDFQKRNVQILINLTTEHFPLCLNPFYRSFGPEKKLLLLNYVHIWLFRCMIELDLHLWMTQWTIFREIVSWSVLVPMQWWQNHVWSLMTLRLHASSFDFLTYSEKCLQILGNLM